MINRDTTASVLKKCIETLEQKQSVQKVDYTSIITKKWTSQNQYDFSVDTTAGQIRKFILTVASVSGDKMLLTLDWWYSINNADVINNFVFSQGSQPSVDVSFIELPMIDNSYQFSFVLRHNQYDTDNLTSYFKFAFTGTDDITWNMTEVA